MKALAALLLLAGLLLFPGSARLCPARAAAAAPMPAAAEAGPLQGWAPGELGLATSPDGKTAYVPFALDDSLLVVDLPSLTTVASINVSAAGAMLGSSAAALTPDGKKLFVANPAAGNVLVVDTESRQVEAVLPLQPAYAVAITVSPDGSRAYIPAGDGGLTIINTTDNSPRQIFVPGVIFGPVVEAPGQPDLLYSVGKLVVAPGVFQPVFFAFDVSTRSLVRSAGLPADALPAEFMARRLVVNAAETRAYFGYTTSLADRRTGALTVFDLERFEVQSTAPVENGVADFAVNEQTGRAYIIGFWSGGSAPNTLPVHEWDLETNSLLREIMVSPSADQRGIALGPAGEPVFYMTEGDHNLLRKVDIATGREIGRVQFNREQLKPYAFLRDGNTAYIVCQSSRRIFKLDLPAGRITGSILLPFDFSGWGADRGKLYLGCGDSIVAVNPADGAVVARYPLGGNLNALLFTFYGNRMATIDFSNAMVARRLVVFDAGTMTLLRSVDLPPEPHGDKVIVSPDGAKLYVERGPMMGGAATITIYDAVTLDVLNTIVVPPVDLRRGATGFVEGDFDEVNRILYLAGFASVYKIGMDSNALLGTLDVIDLYESTGRWGWSPTGLAGLALSAGRDRLFAVSGDAHSMYTYDLTHSSWLTQTTNVRGYFVTDALASPDRRYLYTANSRADSISMIDLATGEVERVLDLHDYVHEVHLPAALRP